MRDILPILIVGAIIGTFALLFLVAFFTAKRKKVLENRERNMPDSEIIRRLLAYAKPYRKHFVLVFFVMLLANVYSVVSPLIIGHIEETVVGNFEMSYLLRVVAVYVAILIVSWYAPIHRPWCCKRQAKKSSRPCVRMCLPILKASLMSS